MARRKSSEYRSEATSEPFELVLESTNEDGSERVITFLDPQELDGESAFDLAIETDPKVVLRTLLSEDDWASFWAEWRTRKVREINDLQTDVMEHYAAPVGKRAGSRR
jgi:hypothetical protein